MVSEKYLIGLGGSTGGMQLLEWSIEEPELFEHIVPIATNAVLSPWAIAFNASQRMAIEADSTWLEKRPDAGQKGLAAARSIALLSYRHYNGYDITQPRDKAFVPLNKDVTYAADNYQRYQGLKLVNRFNAFCYYRLSQSMDSHDVGRNRGGVENALKKITARTLVIGITIRCPLPYCRTGISSKKYSQEPNCSVFPVILAMMGFYWNMKK